MTIMTPQPKESIAFVRTRAPPTPPNDIELNDSANRGLTKLLQRSKTDITQLKSLWHDINHELDEGTSFFLRVPISLHDPTPKTRTAILQDAGALLTMPEGLAQLVIWKVEGHVHKLVQGDRSDEQWKKVQTLECRLAVQHPDHVKNVIRLWNKALRLKNENVNEELLKDLGLLWQHRKAEVEVILDKLEMQTNAAKVEDEETVVPKGNVGGF